MTRAKAFLGKEISIAPLVTFRIIFGALACFGAIRFLVNDWVAPLYQDPQFYFTYLGFDWVQPLPGQWMYLPFILLIMSSLGILLGAFYRWSAVLYFLAFTYIELIDKTNYLNHYYLISLLAFLMIFLPAHRQFSLDVKWNRVQAQGKISNWIIFLLQFQLACVYFFAGIAKLNEDWLFRAEPMTTWLQSHRDMPVFGDFFAEKWLAFAFSWIGCIYDLSIAFLLWSSKTRKWAYLAVVVFHLLTYALFPIGVFPFVMIGLTLVFFAPELHERFVPMSKGNGRASAIPKYAKGLILGFIVLQCLLPFRYLTYPGHLFWNEEGFRFSWRVMLMHKEGLATFYVQDSSSGREIEIDNSQYLNKRQEEQMSTQPDMILQYAHYLRGKFADTLIDVGGKQIRIKNPNITANVFVALNGRPAQKLVDKSTLLNEETYNLQHRDWILPFKP